MSKIIVFHTAKLITHAKVYNSWKIIRIKLIFLFSWKTQFLDIRPFAFYVTIFCMHCNKWWLINWQYFVYVVFRIIVMLLWNEWSNCSTSKLIFVLNIRGKILYYRVCVTTMIMTNQIDVFTRFRVSNYQLVKFSIESPLSQGVTRNIESWLWYK